MRELSDYSLLRHNTFGIDARCRRFLEYESEQEAVEAARILRESGEPYIIIGGGSNLLLTRDFPGTVVHSAVKGIHAVADPHSAGHVLLSCGSGETWDDMVATAVEHGWHGAENLSIIPGEVGASAVQNIGAYGAEAKDLIVSVEAVEIATGRTCVLQNAECQYGYRQSRFKGEWRNAYLLVSVTYRLSRTFTPRLDYGNIRAALAARGISQPTALQLRQAIIGIRNEKLPDPKLTGNAGSFFMNPVVGRDKYESLLEDYPDMPHYFIDGQHEKIPAGWLIEQCGWKGRSLGRAGVHDRQALVLVNRGGATGGEVLALCRAIQHDVKRKFGIEIHPEVNVI